MMDSRLIDKVRELIVEIKTYMQTMGVWTDLVEDGVIKFDKDFFDNLKTEKEYSAEVAYTESKMKLLIAGIETAIKKEE